MKTNHIEEITCVMCESCYDIIIEDESQELEGISYCSDCVDEYHGLLEWGAL